MKIKLVCTLLLILLVGGVCWWYVAGGSPTKTPAQPSGPAEKLQVVVSGYVPYVLTREIAGPHAQLTMLVPPGTEAHSFEPTPGAIIAVEKADLFIYVSEQVEPWVKDILQGLSGENAVASGPVDDEQDPHVWMSPYGALSMAQHIEKALSKADPAHKNEYKQNFRQFEKQIQQLHTDFVAGLSQCKSRELVHVGHLAFGNLADAYQLNLQALSGTSHQGEHSVLKLTGMVRFVRHHQLHAVFTEEMVSPELARTVAEETKVQILPLYTIEDVSKDDFAQGVTYETYMRRNLKNLQEGLQCQA